MFAFSVTQNNDIIYGSVNSLGPCNSEFTVLWYISHATPNKGAQNDASRMG